MDVLKQLLELGTQMGLRDADLQTFVQNEQAKAREEREKERNERQAMMAMEHEFKMEQEKREFEREKEDMAMREHKRKMELLEYEGDRKVSLASSSPCPSTQVKGPKLPPFEEGKDHMDAYIERFERYATAQRWPSDQWSTHLSALLKGRALDVFSRLPVDQALDYKELKNALLKRFELTEDGFRKKFRSARPEQGETFVQFVVRIESYFERWLSMAHAEKTYEGLKDLMLRDQLMDCCGKELTLFLKERVPRDVVNMSTLADQFAEARSTSAFEKLKLTKDLPTRSERKPFKPPNHSPNPTAYGRPKTERRCYECGKAGHLSFECLDRKRPQRVNVVAETTQERPEKLDDVCESENKPSRPFFRGGYRGSRGRGRRAPRGSTMMVGFRAELPQLTVSCERKLPDISSMPVSRGRIGDKNVSVLRDTGCSGVVIRKSLVLQDQMTGNFQSCVLADGSEVRVPTAVVYVDTPYFRGTTKAWCMQSPVYDVILGNIEGVRAPDDPDVDWPEEPEVDVAAVKTRAQKKKEDLPEKPMKVSKGLDGFPTREEIKQEQESDPTFDKIRQLAETGRQYTHRDGGLSKIYRKNGLLYREFASPKVSNGKVFRQLIVPTKFRNTVMQLAHDSILAGHLATKRTADRVLSEFYWPGVQADVGRYCRSCDVCQRTFPKGRVTKVPLGDMPLIDEPFKRVAVDLVGPLHPVSDRGNRFILTLVDYATRYPEAVALPSIDTQQVAEALVTIFSRVGVPREMLTDQGTQFTSDMMKEISRLLSIRGLTTTPYHPSCNGLVERFNGSLKMMLRRMCAERPKDWDRYLNPLLFAYREVPHESLGFSPFELLYGRSIRGPMMILKELWTKELDNQETKSTYQYVVDLRERLEETCDVARRNLQNAKTKQRNQYNRKARDRQMKVGDQVLVLLPTKANKLLMQWKGPYKIVQRVGNVDYRIDIGGRVKTYHANLLKYYVPRDVEVIHDRTLDAGILSSCWIAELSDGEEDEEQWKQQVIHLPPSGISKEKIDDVNVAQTLTEEQQADVRTLTQSFQDILTDLPGRTKIAEHKILVTTSQPVRVKQYPLPYGTKETIQKEVETMLAMDVIEPSESPYSSPVVIVRKKDGTNRFCIDFRMLNRVTVFDAEPMPSADDIFSRLAANKYFTKIDLSKGYWQVPVADDCKPLTAFTTPQGLFQFKVMPFGLVNAPATFSRMMRRLLKGMTHVENFIDDILIYTKTWEEHLETVKGVLGRLKSAGLTMRPSKCFIGYRSLECLGHVVGNQQLQAHPDKLSAIKNAPVPTTKKQVRFFLGLAGFYRKFVPNFATVAAPLTDLTKKGQPNHVKWTESQDVAFFTFKNLLCAEPILKLSDLDQEFILRTDASDTGLGAVLLQYSGDEKLPVAYASRKLLPRERNYAVVEKECLAIVWAVQKFSQYLYGKEFVTLWEPSP